MQVHKSWCAVVVLCVLPLAAQTETKLCLDSLCIGESINDPHFSQVNWGTWKELTKRSCAGIACKPEVNFRGYQDETQKQLAEALSWTYGSIYVYNVITKSNIGVLQRYKYECSNSERHFIGAYFSTPSHYLTIVGLRLIGGELRVYRIARQYPFRNKGEFGSLVKALQNKYGDEIVFYNGDSSNAYSDVIAHRKLGWFGRSTLFNPLDPSDNAAELVLIDPQTRPYLQPTDMPESGDIPWLRVNMPEQCVRSLPIQ